MDSAEIFHVGVLRQYPPFSPLYLWERVRVRAAFRTHTKTPMTIASHRRFHTLKGFTQASDQNAGNTAPLYFFSINALTSGLVRAAASFLMASLFLLSSRATRKFT